MTIRPVMQFTTKISKSPIVDGLQMMEKLAFSEKPTRPTIMVKKMSMNGQTLVEVSTKKLSDDLMLESYNVNGNIIKLIKNKFGEFLAFKTNIENCPFSPQKLVENIQNAARQKFDSFHTFPPSMIKH